MQAEQTHKHTNSLINEDSPYLLQHAHNPVDWHPWNKDTLEKAKKENKLIFLSIGYSTCHWCHVMEEESFENEEIATLLNDNYISIKIDREEMPHIDQYYQNVFNLLNKRGGGWPLTIILTPEKKPFFAGTYIPLDDKYEYVGMRSLIPKINKVYADKKEQVIQSSIEIEQIISASANKQNLIKNLDLGLVDKFMQGVIRSYDQDHHGIGTAPKFPHASTIETLLDIYIIFKDEKALEIATNILKSMGRGGINDQIEGGFYRYSVDDQWQIPHFEKMLYTNAELLSVYSKAYLITKDKFYKNIAKNIVSFVEKRFEKDFVLYSASDADSMYEGKKEEGAYYVFDYKETKKFLQKRGFDNTKQILDYFNISEYGNFENNTNNPYIAFDEQPIPNLKRIKKVLTKLRSKKEYPFIDKKILTSWNAMFISSLFDIGKINDKYNIKAIKYIDSLSSKLYKNDILYHQVINNKKPKVKALFEDYSFFIEALLKAYDYTLDEKYLDLALKLQSETMDKFYKDNSWYMNDYEASNQMRVLENIYDNSYKSATSVMLDNILKIALLKTDINIQKIAVDTINTYSHDLSNSPASSSWFLRSFIGFKKGYIYLKATKDMFEDKEILDYPFLIKQRGEESQYLACNIGKCFAYGNDFDEINRAILKEINAN